MSLKYGNIIKLSNGYMYLVTARFEYEMAEYYVLSGTSGENLEIIFVTTEIENGREVLYQIVDKKQAKELYDYWINLYS